MSSTTEKRTKINTEENEKLKTQIDASIGIARSLIHSWLPPPKPGEKSEDEEEEEHVMQQYSTGRPDRLGLGAKFLSHNDAMRHNNNNNISTKEELQLKNKILNQNKRAAMHREINTTSTPIGKRYRPSQNVTDSDSDDQQESRTTTVGTTRQNKKKKKSTAVVTEVVAINDVTAGGKGKKKIGVQGDFLSMYLSERADKKKKNKK